MLHSFNVHHRISSCVSFSWHVTNHICNKPKKAIMNWIFPYESKVNNYHLILNQGCHPEKIKWLSTLLKLIWNTSWDLILRLCYKKKNFRLIILIRWWDSCSEVLSKVSPLYCHYIQVHWLNRLGLQNTLTASLQRNKTPLTNVIVWR